jgi:hypothetical protein
MGGRCLSVRTVSRAIAHMRLLPPRRPGCLAREAYPLAPVTKRKPNRERLCSAPLEAMMNTPGAPTAAHTRSLGGGSAPSGSTRSSCAPIVPQSGSPSRMDDSADCRHGHSFVLAKLQSGRQHVTSPSRCDAPRNFHADQSMSPTVSLCITSVVMGPIPKQCLRTTVQSCLIYFYLLFVWKVPHSLQTSFVSPPPLLLLMCAAAVADSVSKIPTAPVRHPVGSARNGRTHCAHCIIWPFLSDDVPPLLLWPHLFL